MYANTSVTAAMWNFSYSQTSSNSVQETDGDAFKNIFASSLRNLMSNQAGIQDAMNGLSEKFPGLNLRQGKPGEGLQGTRDFFGNAAGDYAAVDESLLAGMAGNQGLFQQVQDALSAFMEQNGNHQAMSGAYMQTSISITYTSVRYNVSQFDEGSGDLLNASETTSPLQAKFKELLERIFNAKDETALEIAGADDGKDDAGEKSAAVEGLLDAAGETGDGDAADPTGENAGAIGATAAAAGTTEPTDASQGDSSDQGGAATGRKGWGSGVSAQSLSWSLQMYYSNEYLMSSFGGDAAGSGGNGNGGGNAQAGGLTKLVGQTGSYFSAGGKIESFSGFSEAILPQSIYDMFLGPRQNSGSGPFTSLLNNGLSGLGMSVNGIRQTQDGFIAQLRESRNLLGDLLAAYANQAKALANDSGDTVAGGAEAAEKTGVAAASEGTETAGAAAGIGAAEAVAAE